MRRLVAALFAVTCLAVIASPSDAARDDPNHNPPPEGGPGSETEHLFNPRLGGCRFSNPTTRPVNPDDVPSMGRCRRPERPTDEEDPGAPEPIDIALDVTFDLDWPDPLTRTAPDWRSGAALTGVATWLWVDGIEPISAQSTGAGVVVQVTARPVSTTWNLRAGEKRCTGLGVAYARGAESDCTFTFADASEKPLRASVFVSWQVSWTASDGSGGSFGRAVTGAPFSLEVDEAQAVTD